MPPGLSRLLRFAADKTKAHLVSGLPDDRATTPNSTVARQYEIELLGNFHLQGGANPCPGFGNIFDTTRHRLAAERQPSRTIKIGPLRLPLVHANS